MVKTTILIVEDEAIVAADLAGKLGQLGYEVLGTTARGEEAVDLACSLKPQVVLMDIRLKGSMDGIETAEAIRHRHCAPVIYLTAHSDAATLERAMLSEPFGYILKPFEERELSTAVEMALYKHKSDRQLREQREWLRVTLASIGDAVITCDTDCRVTFLNPIAEALTGWSTEEARERPIQEVFSLINEQTRQPPEDPVALVLREGRPKALANHTALITRDGREVPIEDSAAPILDADGQVIGVVLVFHDVTEKRRAYEALQESEARLQTVNEELQGANEELQAQSEELQAQSEELQTQNDELARLWGESKRGEEALRVAKKEWERTFDSVPDLIAIIDKEHKVLRVNEAMARRIGHKAEECVGLKCYEAVHGTSVPPEFCPHSRTIDDGREHIEEVHEAQLGGDFLVTTTPLHDEQGLMIGTVHVAHDITGRKRSEEERQTSVDFLRLVNETRSSADLIQAATLFFNEKSGCEAVGIRLKEGDDYPYFEAHGFPEEFVLLENSLCDYNENGEVIRDSNGDPIIECVCGNVICGRFDPTKPFFTNSGSFWTNCTTELLASTTEADRQARTRNRCNGQGYESVALIPLRLGEERLGLLQLNDRQQGRFSPATIALWERLAGYLTVALTKFKAEEALHQAKEAAEAASRAKSQFLANMSHELRTPMTGVLGMLEFALNTTLDAQQQDLIETAHKSARTLLRILNDILDLAKVEAGKLSLEIKPFGLRECVAGAVDILVPEARLKGLELKSTAADDLPKTVVGDQVRLLQVLTNLLGNAVKYTERGQVSISVTSGSQTQAGKKEIIFNVADSGIGIPANKKEMIFQSFTQADESHTRKFGGVGLGLAISRELVERMGGTIFCESEEGVGSSFSFTIPFGEERIESEKTNIPMTPPVSSIPIPTGEREKARILLVEDDPITRKVIGMMLQKSNFDIDIAEHGLQAVEMWEKGNYDLTLMDVQMPHMDGFAATSAIREKERENDGHTLIVAMTAHAFPEDEIRCRAAGMDAYISKPIDMKQCIALIEDLIGKRDLEA